MPEWHDMYSHVRIRDALISAEQWCHCSIVEIRTRIREKSAFCSGRSGNESNSRKLIIISQLTISFVSKWLRHMSAPAIDILFLLRHCEPFVFAYICPKNYLNRHKSPITALFPMSACRMCDVCTVWHFTYQPHVHMFRANFGNRQQRQLKNYLQNLLIIF